MSADSKLIQDMISTAPPQIGVYAKTIQLEPRQYLIDEAIKIERAVRLQGNNTAIVATSPDITAFEVGQSATGTRFEQISFVGYSGGSNFPDNGGIGLDVMAGRVIVDNCYFDSWRIPLFLHSNSESGTLRVGNADGFMVRDCEVSNSIYGLWALGGDAQVGLVMNCRFQNCRKAITEQSAFGNHYVSIYINNCPNVEGGDPKAAEGYGISVVTEGPLAQPANASAFTSVWLESGTKAEVNSGCAVLGGNMPQFVRRGDRVGLNVCALGFRGGCNNPEDFLFIGGDAPSVMRAPPNGGIAFLQRNGDVYSYRALWYCSADPNTPDAACTTPDEQGWKLRDGSTTYPCTRGPNL